LFKFGHHSIVILHRVTVCSVQQLYMMNQTLVEEPNVTPLGNVDATHPRMENSTAQF